MLDLSQLVQLLAHLFAVVIVISLHEFAHAFVAYKCGDPTAKFAGRMTLNPVRHFDLLGLLSFLFLGFGWAKPVPINPYNFKHYKRGAFLTSAAGVIVNYITAFLVYPILALVVYYLLPVIGGKYAFLFLVELFNYLLVASLCFCVFNLLPFYPLDGFRIVDVFSKKRGKVYTFLRQYGYYILLGLMLISILADRFPIFAYIDLLNYIMTIVVDLLGWPITYFWNWIFSLIIV